MSTFKDRISTAIETAILSRVKNNSVFSEYYKRSSSAQKADWTRQAQNYKAKTIKDWTMAVMMATDTLNPRRGELMRFFESLKLDLHLCSCVDNRILPIQCAPFKLTDKSGTEDTEAHKLFEKPWYIDIVKLICLNIYEGTKLIEMMDVNDKGELAQVTEIPQSNFLADKGIIIKEEYDSQGVNYKEGLYKDYYIQIGNNYNLGLFNQVAMIVLAKKLGLGSWMAYIDKFGVPPVFAITDRMDDTRVNELFEMLQNFRSNHFAVLKGNEKIEVPNNYGTDGYQSFKALNEHCDDAISKFFLGGTGTSDAKSFVGSAEVHERLLKYRHQVDKLLLKFYMNEEIIPRLIKLSSVYAPLANLYFEFDESETMTLAEKIKAVVELAPYLQFDAEALAKLTGLPITGVKEILSGTTPPVTEPQKKKPNASVAGAKSYIFAQNSPFEGCPTGGVVLNKVFAATWDAAIERLATQIYNGEVKPSDLDKDLVLKNYSALSKSSQAAWGNGYYNDELTRKMRDNIMKFSGAKSYDLMTKLQALNVGGISKEAFILQSKSVINLHNEAWLNTEQKYVANKTSTAKDFIQFNADIDIYPNLKVRTMQDDNVRESHAANEGVVMPVNKCTYTPPFDPGCRCWLEQTTDEVTDHGLTNMNSKWATNPYPSGELFSKEHSYQKSIEKKQHTIVTDNTNRMKQYAPYNRIEKSKGGNSIFINDFADASEVAQNKVAAEITADLLDKNIYIRAHINTSTNHKNPELAIGNPTTLCDLKTYDKDKSTSIRSFIKNNIGSANNQGCEYVVLDLSSATKDDFEKNTILKLRGELNDKKKMNTGIKQIIIINGNKSGVLSRKQINSNEYITHFDKLFK